VSITEAVTNKNTKPSVNKTPANTFCINRRGERIYRSK
jgi:hypothetical protein